MLPENSFVEARDNENSIDELKTTTDAPEDHSDMVQNEKLEDEDKGDEEEMFIYRFSC